MSNESRLIQIEKLLETSAKMIVRHDREIADLRELTARNEELINRNAEQLAVLREQTNRNTKQLARLSDIFIESIAVIKEMQNQVRGIQTENQRILNHFFGEND